MGWSGGTYTKGNAGSGGWVGDAGLGIGIEASRHDTQDNDFATGINNCLAKDGQNTPTANLGMGGYKHTGVGNATAADQYLSYGQLLDVSKAVTTGGTAPNYEVTLTPAPAAYFDGMTVVARIHASNTTAPATLNVNGLGAKSIRVRDPDGTTTRDAFLYELNIGHPCIFVYDGASARFILANPCGGWVVDNSEVPFTTGTRPDYELTTDIRETTTLAGRSVKFRCHSTFLGGTATLNVNGTGVKNLKVKAYSTVERELLSGELAYGGVYEAVYEGGEWVVTNPTFSAANVTFTPSFGSSSGTISTIAVTATYCYLNANVIQATYALNLGLSGFASDWIKATLPVNNRSSFNEQLGTGWVFDATGYPQRMFMPYVSANEIYFYKNEYIQWPIDPSFSIYAQVIYPVA